MKIVSRVNNLCVRRRFFIMKKRVLLIAVLLCTIGIFCFAFAGMGRGNEAENAYLRVHIRANSNLAEDQNVKYKVRDGVVAYLTPAVAECATKREAMEKIKGKLEEIALVARNILKAEGYDYGARASLRQEEFPTRVYEGVTLQAGVYDALILELGTGSGDNWWCVVYPPLCFTSGNGNVIYKSKIAEIIKKFYS